MALALMLVNCQFCTKNTPHDFVYIKNNDLPKEVGPIVTKNRITAILQNTNLPIEVEPIVALKRHPNLEC